MVASSKNRLVHIIETLCGWGPTDRILLSRRYIGCFGFLKNHTVSTT
jgi:hypothetical protein